MEVRHVGLLFGLSAIWGSAFMFYAYLTPHLGIFLTAGMRLLIAGLFLSALFLLQKRKLGFKKNWRHYLIVGVLNSAIPFVLYSWASTVIPSSVEVVLNALTPVFGAIFSVLFLHDKLSLAKGTGIALGFAGVVILAGLGPFPLNQTTILGCLACVLATASYAIAAVYLKLKASHVTPRENAAGSQTFAGILVVPLFFVDPPKTAISVEIGAVLLLFALLCSAVAYLMYYKLVEVAGPTTALSVTFPMPIFGFLWGGILLGERFTVGMIVGSVVVIAGMYLITRTTPGKRAAKAT